MLRGKRNPEPPAPSINDYRLSLADFEQDLAAAKLANQTQRIGPRRKELFIALYPYYGCKVFQTAWGLSKNLVSTLAVRLDLKVTAGSRPLKAPAELVEKLRRVVED